MKLRNKKTGEIVELVGCMAKNMRIFLRFKDLNGVFKFEVNSLAELNKKWEDYEEPKDFWFIDDEETKQTRADLDLLFGGEE